MVWDIFSGPTTTVAAASNGGTISGIATWANPSAGVLAVANAQFFNPAGGTGVQVATSGTPAVISYTGVSGNTLTGCTFTSGSGTVATGGSVVLPIPVANSTFYFGQFAGGANTQGIRVTGCGRSQAGPNGTTAWDVECESTTSQVYIEGWTNKSASVSTLTNAFFNFHGCHDVLLLNNQSPQGASVNGNSTTVITNPSPNQLAISEGQLSPEPNGLWTPKDHGYLNWSYDPALTGGNSTPATGVMQVTGLRVRTQLVVTNIIMNIQAAPTGALTSGQNWAALYTSAGVQVGLSADQTTPWATTGTKTMALASGPFTIAPGNYFVVFVSNVGSLLTPGFARMLNVNATITNINLGTGSMRAATNATVTTLPAPLVPGSNVAAQNIYWAALS
jgi:hypothetical protein